MTKLRFPFTKVISLAALFFTAVTVFGQNFDLTLQPNSLTLIPNETSSLVVDLSPFNGFTNPVTLSTGVLPSGVTAQFSPQTLTPPGTAVLTLSATTNATLGEFTLNVTGTGGGRTNTTSSSVTVNFGLLPICTGAYSGQVTDAYTGLPVTNAYVQLYEFFGGVQTDAHGFYTITNVSLQGNNSPTDYGLDANATGYWQSAVVFSYAVCDATNIVNLEIVPKEYATVSGHVTYVGGAPATNTTVSIDGAQYTTTDTSGFYEFTNVDLAYTNAPTGHTVEALALGIDWTAASNIVVRANSNVVQDLVLLPLCFGNVSGRVFYADTLEPATNAYLQIYGSQGAYYGQTDASGNYTITNISLQKDGTLSNSMVSGSAPGYYSASTNVSILNCGATAVAPDSFLPPQPRNYYGTLTGHVYDIETGFPLGNVEVSAYTSTGFTDSNGFYNITNIVAGQSPSASVTFFESAGVAKYYESGSNVTVFANQSTTQDIRLLKMQYAGLTGVVRDSATSTPITNAYVQLYEAGQSFYVYTDTNGVYVTPPLSLNFPNAPTPVTLTAMANKFYPATTNSTLTAGVTNVVDLYPIKVCPGATIIGTVVNALTQAPITNAYLNASSVFTYTDTNGNFVLTNITVGNNNSPILVTINASAPGFISQSKQVTVFCNATILTEFGVPQTAFGIIDGVVTNEITGLPLTNVFIGSEFGESTTTDTNGFYQLTQAPLGANNAARTWNITAIPSDFTAQTLPVTVTSNAPAVLNFGFGEEPTALVVTATGAPNPVTVSNVLVYFVNLTNTVADAPNVVLSDTLPPNVTFVSAVITNSPGTPFSAPVLSNNVVTTTATSFPSNSAVSIAITVTPIFGGTLTNIATVSSPAPDLDPTGADRKATVLTTVQTPPQPTALGISLEAAPASVTEGSNLLYTITLTNSAATASNTVVTDTLPPSVVYNNASFLANPGGAFGAPVYSGGQISLSAAAFASNSVMQLLVSVTPTSLGSVTNMVIVTSATTDVDPTGSNRVARVVTPVTAPVVPPFADLAVAMTVAPNPVLVSNQLTYTLRVTNFGPMTASSVVLTDTLPANVTFGSATVSQGSYTLVPEGLAWSIGSLANQGTASATVVVLPLLTGTVSNYGAISLPPGSPSDTNLVNNTAIALATVTAASVTNLSISAGPITFNPQTGLYEQSVTVNNLSGLAALAVRLIVLNLSSSAQLYNATGTTNGSPYVEYDQPLAAGASVVFGLEFYDKTRTEFASPDFAATEVVAVTVPTPSGTVLQLDANGAFLSQGELTIEFATVPGRTYVVQYSSDMETWLTAAPPIVAKNTRTQWVDAGPPETISPPGQPGQRFYRVVQTN